MFIIHSDSAWNIDEFKAVLLNAYPKLNGKQFELLKGEDGGPSRPLKRIDDNNAVPSITFIKSALGWMGKIVYIRPYTDLLVITNTCNTVILSRSFSKIICFFIISRMWMIIFPPDSYHPMRLHLIQMQIDLQQVQKMEISKLVITIKMRE